MPDRPPHFCLLDQPWIPCVDLEGRVHTLGIRQVLQQAADLRDIVGDNPLQTSALFRLLLAITHRVVEGPTSIDHWCALWDAGALDATALNHYCDAWKARFDLFDLEYPFFQVGGLATIDKKGAPTPPAPVTALFVERARGHNGTLFDHSAESYGTAALPEAAARALVATQAWGLCGGQGPTTNLFGIHPYMSHAPLVGAWYAQLVQPTLFHTLLANLLVIDDERPVPRTGHDAPVWEQRELRAPGECTPRGYLDYLTLPARYVRLLARTGDDELPMVDGVYLCPGLVAKGTQNPGAFYREDPKKGRFPIGLRQGRALWRDSASLLSHTELLRPRAFDLTRSYKANKRLHPGVRATVRSYGLANDKGKPLVWREESLAFHANVLEDDDQLAGIEHCLKILEDHHGCVARALKRLADTTEQSSPRLLERADYWPGAGELFRDCVLEARIDEVALNRLRVDAERLAKNAFARASEYADGEHARRERAIALAQQALFRELQKLRPQPSITQEVT